MLVRQLRLSISSFDTAAFVALLATVITAAHAYATHERFLYFWDWAGFHASAADFVERLMSDPGAGVTAFRKSLEGEYNLVFALPLIPVLASAGGARAPYIVAIAGLYLVPFAMLTGVVCRRAFPELGRIALWCGAGLAVLVPPVWLSVMRGYPDVLAAAAVMAALAVVMPDLRLGRWRTVLCAAALLAAAVVIRRHMLFAALSVMGTVALLWLRHRLDLLRANDATRDLQRELLRVLAFPTATLAFLALLQPAFLVHLVRNDYGSLYASYQRPPLDFVSFLWGKALGPIFFVLGGLGLFLGVVRGRLRCRPDTALTLYGLLWLASWLVLVRQDGSHQIIVGLPILVIAGVLQVATVARGSGRRLVPAAWLAAVGAYAVSAALVVNGPDQRLHWSLQDRLGILSMYAGPLRRDDFEEVKALISTLRDGPQPVLIAASNDTLNFDLVYKAEPHFFGRSDRRLSVLASPQIDSRDPLPVDDLLRAGQVVVVTPFQFHLSQPAEQDVVRVLLTAFAESWPISSDFRLLEETFPLQRGAVARVYRRERPPTLETAFDTYRRVVAETEARAHRFRDVWFWEGTRPPGLRHGVDGEQSFFDTAGLTLLRPLAGAHRIEGFVRPEGSGCTGVRMEAVDVWGGVAFGRLDAPVGRKTPFRFDVDPSDEALVRLAPEPVGDGVCSLNFTHLRVDASDPLVAAPMAAE
jgi:hypothetical protein